MIVAGNPAAGAPSDIVNQVSAASANNLLGDAATSGGLAHGSNSNIVGNGGAGTIDISTVLVTTLAANGGSTRSHQLVPGSLAIDAGSNAQTVNQNGEALTIDQRCSARIIDHHRNGVATAEIGAVELQASTLGLSGAITYTENGGLTPPFGSLDSLPQRGILSDSPFCSGTTREAVHLDAHDQSTGPPRAWPQTQVQQEPRAREVPL